VKKRILFIMLAVVLALSVGIMGCNGGQQEEEEEEEEEPRTTIELSFITFWPSGDFQAGIGHQAYMDTIAERVLDETDDYEIEWTAYYAGTAPAGEIYSLVGAGTYDIGATGPGYSPGVFPLCDVMNLAGPVLRPNAYTMSLAKKDLLEWSTDIQDEIEAQNLRVFFWSVGPGYFLMTEGNEVKTLEDFAGKTIRAPHSPGANAIIALGAEALSASMDEAKEKFEAGLIQGILCPTDTPKGFGLAEFVKHLTYAPCTYDFVFMQVMNQDKYDSLPAEVRDIFDEVDDAWPAYYGQLRTWGENDGLEFCRDEVTGWTEYYLPSEDPTEYARWNEAVEPLVDAWVGGDATRQAIWDKYAELLEHYATTAPYSTWTPGTNPPEAP
jgi:TRAP-type C4-dicarboxylate transport system substrate-binding protein